MTPPPRDGASGRRLVIGMLGSAVILGILAMFLRQPLPSQRRPTSGPATTPAAGLMNP